MSTENKTMQIPSKLYRDFKFERVEGDDSRLRLSISSDEPYKRWDWEDGEYWEVLDHANILDERLKAGMPLLYNHDRDTVLGRSEGYQSDGHKCFVEPVLSGADDVRSHVDKIREGTLRDSSIGYEVVGKGREIGKKDGLPIISYPFRIFEASIVTIPADISVGVGRMRKEEQKAGPKEIEIEDKKDIDSARRNEKTTLNSEKQTPRTQHMEAVADPVTSDPKQIERAQSEGTLSERKRVSDIRALSKHFAEKGLGGRKIDTTELAGQFIDDGKSLQEFKDAVMTGAFKDVQPIQTPDTEDLNGRGDGRIEVIGERQGGSDRRRILSVGDAFTRNAAYLDGVKHRRKNISVELPEFTNFRATAATSTITSFNGIVQLPNIIELGVQQATVADLLAQGTTNLNSVPYLQEDTFTNAAASVAEGAAKPEFTWDWSQTSAPVKKIAALAKVTDELFSDVPTLQSYVNARMRYGVEIAEDAQLLTGDGTGANLTGIVATAGIQTQAKGADTVPDAVRKAMTKVQSTGFFPPDGAVFHPNDWEQISLLKDANGQYLAGGPFYAPYGTGQYVMFYRIWGLNVVVTTSMTENTGLVGSFKLGAMIFRRQGLTLDSTNSNEDDFKNNLILLRAEERLALAVWRPKAFCQVTGI